MSSRESTVHRPAAPDAGTLRPALMLALLTLLCAGLAYALVATGLGRLLFPAQAQGSLVERDGRIVGSALVAQPFADARYFIPRPSAAGFDPMAMAGSNQARSNPELLQTIADTRAEIAARDGIDIADVPADLATRSGSGVDPHISPDAARVQIARVAAARRLDPAQVRALVGAHTQGPTLGVLGAARVDVLALNLALDAADATRGAE
ncbi:potassium-transporting ATPase subunit KdpC [Luteimonas sp. SMYT11W]|uniref:Potassium-transporting ATPase KdpC subunit n=1 Tax=Luteimonas flava TaxID=3115822 RepID=A0ABU7WDV4_9GAMM